MLRAGANLPNAARGIRLQAMNQMRAIELFAGAGGLGIGISRAGFKPVKVAEWNDDCRNTLALNQKRQNGPLVGWPSDIESDVRDIDYSEFEGKVHLVSGGPPCQPFSLGGKHNAQADNRDMFPEAVRAVREVRPDAFIFENVKGLKRATFDSYYQYILLQLAHPSVTADEGQDWSDHFRKLQRHHTGKKDTDADYRVVTATLNAADFGIPQQRHRVFFVGIRSDLGREYSFPQATHSRAALIQSFADGSYLEKNKITKRQLALPPSILSAVRNSQRRGMAVVGDCDSSTAPWKTVREAFADLPAPTPNGVKGWSNHHLRRGARAYPGHLGSHVDQPAKALKAGVHGVPGGENMLRYSNGRVRYFSVRESARLQTFPDDYEITGSWSEAMRQLGNAVPVDLAYVVASELQKTLSQQK